MPYRCPCSFVCNTNSKGPTSVILYCFYFIFRWFLKCIGYYCRISAEEYLVYKDASVKLHISVKCHALEKSLYMYSMPYCMHFPPSEYAYCIFPAVAMRRSSHPPTFSHAIWIYSTNAWKIAPFCNVISHSFHFMGI